MKFFNLDLHVSVIADLKDIFHNLGHEIVDWSISGSCWVTGVERKSPNIINDHTWKNLTPELADSFYHHYKEYLDQFDGFICAYPPAFSLLYEKTNKPIIIVVPIRYEHPFTADPIRWGWLNQYLQMGIDAGRIIAVANNKFDAEYFRAWIGKSPKYIPSLCEYTNEKWNPIDDRFIVYSRGKGIDGSGFVSKDHLGMISWKSLYSYSGIVHFPYTCSTMSIFEQYTAGVPLYFPSKSFIKNLYYERLNEEFCGIFYDLSFNRYYNLKESSLKPLYSDIDYNQYENESVIDKFISLCDFYDEEMMPAINTFDCINELIQMKHENIRNLIDNREFRRTYIYKNWKEILDNFK